MHFLGIKLENPVRRLTGFYETRFGTDLLTVAGDGAQLAWQEVIWRPGAADYQLAVFKLLGRRRIAVLVLLHGLGLDQVGDVDQHAVRRDPLATDLFLQRIEKFVDLDGESASLGLAFPLARCLLAQLDQVLSTDRIRELDINHGLSEGAITHHELKVHLRLALELGHALAKGAAIRAHRVA